MKNATIFAAALAAAVAVVGAGALARAQQPNVERKVLLQQDLTIPGYQNVLVAVTTPAGGAKGGIRIPARCSSTCSKA